jgi:hypothetical protein
MSVRGQRETAEAAPLQPLAVAREAEAAGRSVGIKEINLHYHVNRRRYPNDPIRY